MGYKTEPTDETAPPLKSGSRYWSLRIGPAEIWILVAFFTIAGLLLVFGHIAEEVFEGDAAKFDETILLAFRSPNGTLGPIGPPWVEEAARDVTALGSYTILSIIFFAVLSYLLMAQQRAAAFWVFAAVSGGVVLSNLLKLAFERPRPDLVPPAVRVFSSSFPSGHATLSAITYLTLGALLASLHPSLRFKTYFLGLAALLTILVGISRIYLGVHYPTDVIAGWCVGAAWAAFCWCIFRWLKSRGQIEASN
jgi:undecaprenyl-diphosphatase